MKNLLVITLFFFSIGAMAEDKYRCKLFQGCEDEKCTTNTVVAYESLIVDEGWFKNELFFDGKDWSKNTLFGKNILHWGVYSVKNFGEEGIPGEFSKYAMQYKFDKTTLVLEGYKSYREPQESTIQRLSLETHTSKKWQYLCEKTN